ncbi:penicillin-binding protein 2 [Patescibacteria group bacterium]|nr:penicillin-binding protein 2 [Patescibacteria group bacterium]MBU1931663.1 penicillin-binding protein 2 [Patescibacteria group bacterium]
MDRVKIVFFCLSLGFILVIGRLFYWQILKTEGLAALAESQYFSSLTVSARRGEILDSDGFPLVANQPSFLAFVQKKDLKITHQALAEQVAPFLTTDSVATLSAEEQAQVVAALAKKVQDRLDNPNLAWVPVGRNLSLEKKQALELSAIQGLDFQESSTRFYPEASMAAQLLGFVGKDDNDNNQGYFGLEGFYNLELAGRPGILRQEKDALGKPILLGNYYSIPPQNGSSLGLFLDRGLQFMLEEELSAGLARYGAKAGSITLIEPQTGAILGMVSLPHYSPADYSQSDSELFKNPVVAETYEPGSTFKVLVMAAALDAEAVKREDKCDQCEGPRQIGEYTIRTWNEEYHPDATLDEILQYSDNVGMIFVGEQLGLEPLLTYIKNFGFGNKTGIDLQEETASFLRLNNKWGQVGLATLSFGQGIAVTRIQMLAAVSAIANQGQLMEPHVAAKVINSQKTIAIEPRTMAQVIKPETAAIVTDMMVNAVNKGEAQWAVPQGYKIAGKTGTSQIPIAGHYDEEKTITSFIGFAPADEPRFAMLVTLREPSSSPWGSETAAPLFFRVAKKLFLYFNIPPE